MYHDKIAALKHKSAAHRHFGLKQAMENNCLRVQIQPERILVSDYSVLPSAFTIQTHVLQTRLGKGSNERNHHIWKEWVSIYLSALLKQVVLNLQPVIQ